MNEKVIMMNSKNVDSSVSILLIKITCWTMYQCLGHSDRNSDLLGLCWDFSLLGGGVVFSFNIFFKAPRLSQRAERVGTPDLRNLIHD